MIRALFLLFAITGTGAAAYATDLVLPDTLRIRAGEVIRIPVAGKLPRLGQIDVTIRVTPGVVRIADVVGDPTYAVTCPTFGPVSSRVERRQALATYTCGSAGAGVHDTVFALVLEGVYGGDDEGILTIDSIALDSVQLQISSNTCVLLRSPEGNGQLDTPTAVTGNYPNPFSTVSRLSFSVAREQVVAINVRTMQGRLIKAFPDIPAKAGEIEFTMNFMESEIASGRYIVELVSSDGTVYHSMAVMR